MSFSSSPDRPKGGHAPHASFKCFVDKSASHLSSGCRWNLHESQQNVLSAPPEIIRRRESKPGNSPTGTARPTQRMYIAPEFETVSTVYGPLTRLHRAEFMPRSLDSRQVRNSRSAYRQDVLRCPSPIDMELFRYDLEVMPEYNGNPDSLPRFTEISQSLANNFRDLLGERRIIDSILSKLKGQALEALESGRLDTDTVESLLHDLSIKFGYVGSPDDFKNKMYHMHQIRGELVTEYGFRMQKLLHRRILAIRYTFRGVAKEIEEVQAKTDALRFFLAGLVDPPEYRVALTHPKDLDDAITKSVQLYQTLKPKGTGWSHDDFSETQPLTSINCYRTLMTNKEEDFHERSSSPPFYEYEDEYNDFEAESVSVDSEYSYSGRPRLSSQNCRISTIKVGQSARLTPPGDVKHGASYYCSLPNRGIRNTANFRKKIRSSHQPYTTLKDNYLKNKQANNREKASRLSKHFSEISSTSLIDSKTNFDGDREDRKVDSKEESGKIFLCNKSIEEVENDEKAARRLKGVGYELRPAFYQLGVPVEEMEGLQELVESNCGPTLRKSSEAETTAHGETTKSVIWSATDNKNVALPLGYEENLIIKGKLIDTTLMKTAVWNKSSISMHLRTLRPPRAPPWEDNFSRSL